MEKNGHWYTDKNGKHYFVENGQSPKEGWEASNRRKMLKNGKYNVSEDGVNYKEVGEDEYRKFEADEDFDIDDVDSVRDFDEEEEREYVDNARVLKSADELPKIGDAYGYSDYYVIKVDKTDSKDGYDIYTVKSQEKESRDSKLGDDVDVATYTFAVKKEDQKEIDNEVTDEDISQTLEDASWMTDDLEELAEIVAKQMNIDKDKVMSVINKEKGDLWESEEDKLWDRYEKGEITAKERESLNSERQRKLIGEDEENGIPSYRKEKDESGEEEDDLSDVENGTFVAYGKAGVEEIRDAKRRNYYIEYDKKESAGEPRYWITIDKTRNYNGTPKNSSNNKYGNNLEKDAVQRSVALRKNNEVNEDDYKNSVRNEAKAEADKHKWNFKEDVKTWLKDSPYELSDEDIEYIANKAKLRKK